MSKNYKKDWRIGITIEVLILGLYTAFSIVEATDSAISPNFIDLLILCGLTFYTINLYRIQRSKTTGELAELNFKVGFLVLAVMAFFALANLVLMMTGELSADVSYFNLIILFALGRSLHSLKKIGA